MKLFGKKTGNEHIGQDDIVFNTQGYLDITNARFQHFKSLALDLAGMSVVDIGCGIGHFSPLFLDQGCRLTSVDGRPENIEELKKKYPNADARVVNVEGDELLSCGKFDVSFCYGIMYHLMDPLGFIRRLSSITEKMLILETCITDDKRPLVHLVKENQTSPDQALCGWGSRPSPSYIIEALRTSGLSHVYLVRPLPAHEQFTGKRKNSGLYFCNGNHIREIFVASRSPLNNSRMSLCE